MFVRIAATAALAGVALAAAPLSAASAAPGAPAAAPAASALKLSAKPVAFGGWVRSRENLHATLDLTIDNPTTAALAGKLRIDLPGHVCAVTSPPGCGPKASHIDQGVPAIAAGGDAPPIRIPLDADPTDMYGASPQTATVLLTDATGASVTATASITFPAKTDLELTAPREVVYKVGQRITVAARITNRGKAPSTAAIGTIWVQAPRGVRLVKKGCDGTALPSYCEDFDQVPALAPGKSVTVHIPLLVSKRPTDKLRLTAGAGFADTNLANNSATVILTVGAGGGQAHAGNVPTATPAAGTSGSGKAPTASSTLPTTGNRTLIIASGGTALLALGGALLLALRRRRLIVRA